MRNKNHHYGVLNNRFDNRAAILRKAGFTYQRLAEFNIAIFSCRRMGKTMTIQAATVLNADSVVWEDTLAEAQRFMA